MIIGEDALGAFSFQFTLRAEHLWNWRRCFGSFLILMWKFSVEADQTDAVWEDEQTSNEGLFLSLPLAEGMC